MPVSTRKHYPIQTMNRSHFAFTRHAPRAQGFSLVEMAMVLLVVGVLAALFLPATNTMMDNNRRKETRTKLESLESAITRFVMTNQRLPCPADGAQGVSNANSGLELRDPGPPATCTAMSTGIVPWRTLGVPVDSATDAWGNLITYRVWARTDTGNGSTINTSLAMDGGMNMSLCDPAGTGPLSPGGVGCFKTTILPVPPATETTYQYTSPSDWLNADGGRGFRACDAAPSCVLGSAAELASKANRNGVAYFLISHGANKFGAYTPSGVFIDQANGSGPGLRENVNSNGQPLRTITPDGDFYVDADLEENATNYYDDIVLRPTVMKVALDASLGPRTP